MFFKTKVKFLIFSLLLSALMGCANEDQPYYDVPKIQLSGAKCVSETIPKISRYFQAQSNQKEVDEIWSCYTYALKTFEKYVRGEQERDSFQAKELRNFLEDYFISSPTGEGDKSEHNISDTLLDEMMGIKQLVLGGSRQTLSRVEIEQTYAVIRDFHRITSRLLPHARVLFVVDSSYVPTRAQYAEAQKALELSVQDLTGMVKKRGVRYKISSLTTLLTELRAFFLKNDPQSHFGEFKKYIPALAQVKALLLASNPEAIEPQEWGLFGQLTAQTLDVALRTYYYLSASSLYDLDHQAQLDETFQQGVRILRDGIKRRDNLPFTNIEIENVAKELGAVDALPFGLKFDEFKPLVSLIFDFILSPQKKFSESGLSQNKLDYMVTEWEDWSFVQKLLIQDREQPGDSRWQSMAKVLASPWQLGLDPVGRIILNGEAGKTNLKGSTRLNWSRVMFNILYRAYIQDKDRRENKLELSQAELKKAYQDLKPILAGLSLIDKSDTNFDFRLYRDAGLFMPRSDGNGYLGYYELVEYLHFVYSGIDAGSLMLSEAPVECRLPNDFFNVACYRNILPNQTDRYLAHLPFYLGYSKRLTPLQWQRDIRNIELTNRNEGAADTPIANADVYKSYVMLQYIEVIMLRFDEDRSGNLDLKESLRALNHFKHIIGELLGLDEQLDATEIENLFTYMLKYGETPNPVDDPIAEARYINWKNKKKNNGWSLEADRGIFLQILASLQRL